MVNVFPKGGETRTECCMGRGWLHLAKHRDEQELMEGTGKEGEFIRVLLAMPTGLDCMCGGD